MVADISGDVIRHRDFMPGFALDKKLVREVDDLLGGVAGLPSPVVTEADLDGLPVPVQRYLRAAQIIGKPRTVFARARFEGEFRRSAKDRWMPMRCEQYNRIDQPGRLWYAMMKFMPLVTFYVCDSFYHGAGNMYAKLTPWYKMFDEGGPQFDQGELMVVLNDMVFFPSAFLSDLVQWEAVDDHAARATLITSNLSVSGVFYFDDKDDVVNFEGERYAMDSKVLQKWTTPFRDHREVKGLRIPTAGEAIWQQESGPLSYARMRLVDVDRNVFARYP